MHKPASHAPVHYAAKQVLHAAHIEAPSKRFVVCFTQFGTERRAARRRIVEIMAETQTGAIRICKSFFRRANRFTVTQDELRLGVKPR
jgi:hypothetical protein